MSDPRESRLAEYLTAQLGRPVQVGAMTRIAVGHSRAMYRVDTDAGDFVARVEQGGVFGTSGTEECRVMGALARAGFPVATVRWSEPTGEVLGQPFFLMDLLPAALPGGPADERVMDRATAAELVACMARLHTLDLTDIAGAFDHVPATPGDATHDQIDRWAEIYRSSSADVLPLLEEAAAWLHVHAPPLERLAVVHGDAGPGNVVHADGRIVAVTDWEFAHLGDPAEDWSFCMAMRGRRTMPAPAWQELFAEHAGVELSEPRWRYWEAFNLFKGACANTTGSALFASGTNRAPNMAIIGVYAYAAFARRLADLTQGDP